MDWSENNLCIKCDKGGNVLLCNENGCPLAVHERCLGVPARLDDLGRFYCPYCVYKQAVAESHKARELALVRKKALFIFMDGSEKDAGENKTREDEDQSKTVGADVNNVVCEGGKSKSNNDGVTDQPRRVGEEEKVGDGEEDSESPSLKMNGENGNGAVEENRIREEERQASVEKEDIQEEEREASVEKEDVQEEEREVSAEKEDIQEEECGASVEKEDIQEERSKASVEEENVQEKDFGTSSASTNQDSSLSGRPRAKRGSKGNKLVDKESEAVSVLQSKFSKHHDKKKQASSSSTPSRRSSSSMGARKVVKEAFRSPRSFRKSEKPSEKS